MDFGEPVPLGGSVTDDRLPESETLSIAWRQLSGPAQVAFANASSPTSTVTFPVAGDYTLELLAQRRRVSPGHGRDRPGEVAVANAPPQVNLSAPSTVNLNSAASLSASVQDDGHPNGTLSYTWIHTSGPGAITFASPSQTSTTAAFSESGTYVVRLSASDGASTTSKEAGSSTTAVGSTRPSASIRPPRRKLFTGQP